MTLCPRCNANNEAARVACWNCFAPLQGAVAAKVKPMSLVGNGGSSYTAVPAAAAPGAIDPMTGAAPAAAPAKKKGLFAKKS